MSQALIIALLPKFASKYEQDPKPEDEFEKAVNKANLVEGLERYILLIKNSNCSDSDLEIARQALDIMNKIFEK